MKHIMLRIRQIMVWIFSGPNSVEAISSTSLGIFENCRYFKLISVRKHVWGHKEELLVCLENDWHLRFYLVVDEDSKTFQELMDVISQHSQSWQQEETFWEYGGNKRDEVFLNVQSDEQGFYLNPISRTEAFQKKGKMVRQWYTHADAD